MKGLPRAPPVFPPIRQHNCSSAYPEETVWDQHAALVARVPVLRDVLCAHNEARGILMHLHIQLVILSNIPQTLLPIGRQILARIAKSRYSSASCKQINQYS